MACPTSLRGPTSLRAFGTTPTRTQPRTPIAIGAHSLAHEYRYRCNRTEETEQAAQKHTTRTASAIWRVHCSRRSSGTALVIVVVVVPVVVVVVVVPVVVATALLLVLHPSRGCRVCGSDAAVTTTRLLLLLVRL